MGAVERIGLLVVEVGRTGVRAINGTGTGKGGSTTAALLESMRAVLHALQYQPNLPPEQLVARIQEWRRLVLDLSVEAAQGIELATLYEISRAINSSLNLNETLDLVMDALIHLTGAERGCLMLLNEEGELEVRVARNFGDPHDLELSHTVLQNAVESGQPVLTTNAQLDHRFSAQESVIGYQLRSIACIPLHARQKVIGALYLDNRMREGVFSDQDLPLLTAFANQAAIAIENANLYTMTDQALAARVEELTTLQLVDQELNASLDLERVLDLTLSWALKATGAQSGTLSVLDETGTISTMAHTDNDTQHDAPEPELVQLAARNRDPVIIGGKRMLLPVHCKERLVGLLDLRHENGGTFDPQRVEFASRLTDHAAIAIENARLYEQGRANQAKSEFVSLVAHELRTPMTSIQGYADLLTKGVLGPLTPEQTEFLRTISANVGRMRVLVSDLQDVSRIETGQLRLEIQPTKLIEALENSVQATQAQMKSRSQHMTVDGVEGLPLVYADPTRLTQVITNLLSNASKYTPEGGHIQVRAWQEGEFVHCAVSDTGIGISSEDQARLFSKFFRSPDPAVRAMPGTGLGLCIVKSLVELQGGEIAVESQLGAGTTFTFTIPVAPDE